MAFPVNCKFIRLFPHLRLFPLDDREIAAMEAAFLPSEAALKGGEGQVVTVEILLPAL